MTANEGRTFSYCDSCGKDLVLSGSKWRTPPRGYRIVWRPESQPSPEPETLLVPADEAQAPEPQIASEEPEDAEFEEVPRRRKGDRRGRIPGASLPKELAGRERRRSFNRRTGFGKKPDQT